MVVNDDWSTIVLYDWMITLSILNFYYLFAGIKCYAKRSMYSIVGSRC